MFTSECLARHFFNLPTPSITYVWGAGPYTATGVDAFLRSIRDTFLRVSKSPVRSDEVRDKQFSLTDNEGPGIGYDTKEVDAFLEAAAWRLAAMESTDKPATVAASTPTDGSADAAAGGIPGGTPPPWSPDAADTQPFWRRNRPGC